MTFVKLGIFAVAFMFFAMSCGGTAQNNEVVNSNVPVIKPADTQPAPAFDELAGGRKIYETNCALCHNDDGTGGTKEIEGKKLDVDDLTSAKIKAFSDEKIMGYVLNGIEDEGMPAFKGKLTEAQIRDVMNYVRKEIQKMPAASRLHRLGR